MKNTGPRRHPVALFIKEVCALAQTSFILYLPEESIPHAPHCPKRTRNDFPLRPPPRPFGPNRRPPSPFTPPLPTQRLPRPRAADVPKDKPFARRHLHIPSPPRKRQYFVRPDHFPDFQRKSPPLQFYPKGDIPFFEKFTLSLKLSMRTPSPPRPTTPSSPLRSRTKRPTEFPENDSRQGCDNDPQ